MRVALTFAVASLIAGAACSSKRGGAKKIPRDRDARDVVIVDTTRPSEMTFSDEAEPNDDQGHANVIEPGTGMRGTLDGETDADFYRVTLAENGILDAQLSGIEKVDLMLDVRDVDGKIIAKSDRGPATNNEGVPNLALAAGDYYVVVSEFVKKSRKKKKKGAEAEGRQGPSAKYELGVKTSVAPPADFEREPNDGVDGAIKLLIGDEHYGFIGWSKDVDTWEMGLDGFSTGYSADLDITGVDGVTLTLTVLDGDGTPLVTRKGGKGGGLAVRNLVPQLSKDTPSRHYVRIEAKRSHPTERYEIVMTTRMVVADEDEVEPNDAQSTATPLRADSDTASGKRNGFLTTGDEDFYYLEIGGEPRVLDVSVAPPPKTDVKIEVGVVGGSPIGMTDRGKKGATETLQGLPVRAGKMIWIRVHGSRSDKDVLPYVMEWSLEAAGSTDDGAGDRVDDGDRDDDDDDDDGPSLDDLDDYKDE